MHEVFARDQEVFAASWGPLEQPSTICRVDIVMFRSGFYIC